MAIHSYFLLSAIAECCLYLSLTVDILEIFETELLCNERNPLDVIRLLGMNAIEIIKTISSLR